MPMPTPLTEHAPAIVGLPLMMFVRIADSDGKMTAAEMERFDKLIAGRDWCRSPLLQRSLVDTEQGKERLWNLYCRGELMSGAIDVAATLDAVLNPLSAPDRADLEHDLLHFCQELTDAAHGAAGLLRRDRAAQAEHDALLELLRRPSARDKTKPNPPPSAPSSGLPGALLMGDLASEHLWKGGELSLHCVQVVDETHDVKTFCFRADPPKLFCHRPGQFLTVDVPIDGRKLRRSYTISASPSRPHLISVTVKRLPGGLVSNWLHANLRTGDALQANGPFGKFTCIGDEGPYLFISAGSGITPVMAMARWLCDTAVDADIDFIHFARSTDDLVFADELRLMSRRHQGFRGHFICTRPRADAGWQGPIGRISADLLASLLPDAAWRSVYLCGPLGFMDAAHCILRQAGCDRDRVQHEIFGGMPRRNSQAAQAQAGKTARLRFSASNIEVECTGSDYVLDVALDHGIELPFSCRAGQCGSCKVVLLEGAVEHDCVDGLTSDETTDRIILSCQARPVGTVVVDL